MNKKNFTQKQKIAVLKSAEKTNVREVANAAGVHYSTVYDWRQQYKAMGEEAFLTYQVSRPGRGIKQISPEKEQAILKEWKNNPGFGPGAPTRVLAGFWYRQSDSMDRRIRCSQL